MPAIRAVLAELTDRIDDGRCATTDEQEELLLNLCLLMAGTEKRVPKYEACRYLGVSRATFDRMVHDGRMPEGKKKAGWKELSWSLSEIDACCTKKKKKRCG